MPRTLMARVEQIGENQMLRKIVAVVALASSTGAQAEIVALPAAQAYAQMVGALVDKGFVPTFRDSELMLIKTDPLPMKLTEQQGDCGSMFGFAYLKDKRVKTSVSHTVRVKAIDASSADIAISTKVDGYMDVNEGAPFFIEKTRDSTKVLICKSTGQLERELIDSITPRP